MKQILLIRNSNHVDSSWVQNELTKLNLYSVTLVSREQLNHSTLLKEKEFDCLIVESKVLDAGELGFLRSLSAMSRDTAIVILTEQITPYSYSQVHAMTNMVALQNPCDSQVLFAVLEKTTSSQKFRFNVCPRFITNEPVSMVVLKSGLYIPTRMRNYSATGAFLEYRGISLKVGDRIQLRLSPVESSQKSEHLLVMAKVVWIRDGDNARSPARGVGVQFLPTS